MLCLGFRPGQSCLIIFIPWFQPHERSQPAIFCENASGHCCEFIAGLRSVPQRNRLPSGEAEDDFCLRELLSLEISGSGYRRRARLFLIKTSCVSATIGNRPRWRQ